MTEASPVTHIGFLTPELYRPDSVGGPVAQTECRVLDANENEVAQGELGELVMRGPQIMQGYWKSPDATAAVLRDGWYWSGDIVRTDELGLYYVVDRRKEMIKYKGFSIAPAEVESRAAGASRGARLRRRRRAPTRRAKRFPARSSSCAIRKSPAKQTGSQSAGVRRRAPDPLQDAARSALRAVTSPHRLGQNPAPRAAELAVERCRLTGRSHTRLTGAKVWARWT